MARYKYKDIKNIRICPPNGHLRLKDLQTSIRAPAKACRERQKSNEVPETIRTEDVTAKSQGPKLKSGFGSHGKAKSLEEIALRIPLYPSFHVIFGDTQGNDESKSL